MSGSTSSTRRPYSAVRPSLRPRPRRAPEREGEALPRAFSQWRLERRRLCVRGARFQNLVRKDFVAGKHHKARDVSAAHWLAGESKRRPAPPAARATGELPRRPSPQPRKQACWSSQKQTRVVAVRDAGRIRSKRKVYRAEVP